MSISIGCSSSCCLFLTESLLTRDISKIYPRFPSTISCLTRSWELALPRRLLPGRCLPSANNTPDLLVPDRSDAAFLLTSSGGPGLTVHLTYIQMRKYFQKLFPVFGKKQGGKCITNVTALGVGIVKKILKIQFN